MGYYEQRRQDDREEPPGCLDALAITRAVFGVLVWPLAIMFVVIFDLAITLYLYATTTSRLVGPGCAHRRGDRRVRKMGAQPRSTAGSVT